MILNYAAFEDPKLAEGMQVDRLPTTQSMTRLMFSPGAEIIVIGRPDTLIGPPPQSNSYYYDTRRRCDYWLPAFIEIEDDPGTQFVVPAAEWAFHFENLAGWQWIATGRSHARPGLSGSDYMDPVAERIDAVVAHLDPIATTRYQKMIAFRVHVLAGRATRQVPDIVYGPQLDPSSIQQVGQSSPISWLPATDRTSVAEAVDRILSERFGHAQHAREPEWLADLHPAGGTGGRS